jgi:RIO kinase 1
LYQRHVLHSDVVLTGYFEREIGAVDVAGVMRVIEDARAEEAARRLSLQAAE